MVFIFIICLISILSGCYLSGDYPAFRKLTTQFIDKDEGMLLELYNICVNNDIRDISLLDSNDDISKGIVIKYNDKEYYIFISDDEKINPSNKECQRACEIVDYLMGKYPIHFINYYSSIREMEIWFSENFIDADWGITYYPPDVTPPKDIVDREHSEAIKDGFYTYLWLKGF